MTGRTTARDADQVLAEPLAGALRQFARNPRILVAMDFDGTLAPLVDEPMDARALPGSEELLNRLCGLPDTLVAIVSGRALADLLELTRLTEPVLLVGSHGVERSSDPRALSPDTTEQARFAALDEDLAAVLLDHPRARVERKPHSLVLHTRGLSTQDSEAAVHATQEVLTRHTGLVVTPGKEVLEMATRHVGKGAALLDLAAEHEVDSMLFVGDDVTDERAFAMLRPTDLTVKVGPGETTARHRVANEIQVQTLLRTLVELRSAP
ncbi:trehalose-phosphatase [Ornithinimicrobium murale]|uniref:trehalose-phosphatase n=1 Tax=Ornithinimicrobium murale TaxID=1050153 RepID=UPI000E0D46FA|nr:trehalose-phosphatase [Ornithinimicrobium murale]